MRALKPEATESIRAECMSGQKDVICDVAYMNNEDRPYYLYRFEKVNDVRSQELVDTGASRVATACPFCYIMMDDGVKAAGKEEDEVRVADIAMHVLDAIETGEANRVTEEMARQAELAQASLSVTVPAPGDSSGAEPGAVTEPPAEG